MHKIFATYSAALLTLFAVTMHQGYTLADYFSRAHHRTPGQYYHK